jgi:hypothetical protein
MRTAPEDGRATGRRTFLAQGIVAVAATALPPGLDGHAARRFQRRQRHVADGAAVPATRVSLADFGGTPQATPPMLVDAFAKGFAALADAGGGTLLVPPGTYDFGRFDEPVPIVLCRGLRDIVISAYGAVFKAETTAAVMPHLFYFFNFDNVTLAGASFVDAGFTPWINWKGMYCVGVQADRASRGFHMVDCFAEHVLGLFASNNDAAGRQFMSDIQIQGEVRHAYYGVGASCIRENVGVDLDCHNVRRAFIAYALKNAEIRVRASSTEDWPGSNGLVALVCAGARLGNVEDVRVRVDVSGAPIHGSYVHFYHQGPQAEGWMRGVDATVNAIDLRPAGCLFLFDHETNGVRPGTRRTWDRIYLHGTLPPGSPGRVIANTSISTSPGTVYVDRNLARSAGMAGLARGFRVTPS